MLLLVVVRFILSLCSPFLHYLRSSCSDFYRLSIFQTMTRVLAGDLVFKKHGFVFWHIYSKHQLPDWLSYSL
uniref:Putative secreted protein n=1 Tax=Anopheles marajoara TaxID=58244 RepID=A0A2M4CEE8_9DIPT